MGKKRKLQHAPAAGRPKKFAPPSQHKPAPSKQKGPGGGKKKKHHQQTQEAPTIPFEPHDRILLIGEGDLSFAASLIEYHGCTNVTATVLEKDEKELLDKYPHAAANIALIRGEVMRTQDYKGEAEEAIRSAGASIEDQVAEEGDEAHADENTQETEDHDQDDNDEDESDEFDDNADQYDDDDENYDSDSQDTRSKPNRNIPRKNKLLFNVDATKLPPSLSRPPPFTHILFNFPHVGGKSTDVNRQVRHNQSLLVSFFTRALPCLAPGGSVVVTLFEGEPYTLWNVRDLGRHAGLAVERSFRFQAAAYPGYRHARTLGVVRSRKGGVGGGWRGEERAARSYVFRRKGEVKDVVGKKRKKGDESSDDED